MIHTERTKNKIKNSIKKYMKENPDTLKKFKKVSLKTRFPFQQKGRPKGRKKRKIGRNEPCPCGSGKKYKRCCGR